MAETVLVRCANGTLMVHDLPLPWGLAQRVQNGEEQVLGPCDADGNLLQTEPGEPAPASGSGPAPEAPDVVQEPARAGKGSGRDVWAAYAAGIGVTVQADASRDDIIAAVDASRLEG